MPVAGGLNSQLGFKAETVVGTAVTVDRFAEFDRESIKLTRERIEHSGLRPTRRVLGANNWNAGRESVSGDVEKIIQNKGDALFFKHALGTAATTTPGGGTTSRDHKCTVGPLDGLGLTLQFGRTDTTGTTRAFTYSGCKIANWELSNAENGLLAAKFGIDGMHEDTAVALATASYPTGLTDFHYLQGVISVGGAELAVKDWTLTGNNNLDTSRWRIRSTTPERKKEQLEGAGMREYGGTITADFESLTAYNRFVNGTNAAVTLTYTGAIIEAAITYKVVISLPYVRFDGETPNVTGPELLPQSLPFKVLDNLDTDGPVVITITNTDTAP